MSKSHDNIGFLNRVQVRRFFRSSLQDRWNPTAERLGVTLFLPYAK
jgi:hypothetical protein